MNERIKQLADQAGVSITAANENGVFTLLPDDIGKFAELIVQECLEQIYSVTIDNSTDDWDQGYNSGLNQAADTIKTHFGVLE